MTNITFSVDRELHKRMRAYPEIKWSEILRQAIVEYLEKMEYKEKMTVSELRKRLNKETLDQLDNLDVAEEIEFYKKTKKIEVERIKHLTELARSLEE